MTHRDMSYELDGVFAGRNAGELVSVKPARTRIARAPGLKPVGRLPGGDVRNISPELAHKLSFSAPRNITAHRTKNLGIGMGRNIQPDLYHNGTDLADDDADMPFEGRRGTADLACETLPQLAGIPQRRALVAGVELLLNDWGSGESAGGYRGGCRDAAG